MNNDEDGEEKVTFTLLQIIVDLIIHVDYYERQHDENELALALTTDPVEPCIDATIRKLWTFAPTPFDDTTRVNSATWNDYEVTALRLHCPLPGGGHRTTPQLIVILEDTKVKQMWTQFNLTQSPYTQLSVINAIQNYMDELEPQEVDPTSK
ncbi:hypothetical protein BDZ45DRAFT_755130 [Acephala macrosclerotiorum]|nr:hypothetical protein BDZ45DRAFT_755130 [Acephala macrosclerotiorum]